jgi:hypothetical protein
LRAIKAFLAVWIDIALVHIAWKLDGVPQASGEALTVLFQGGTKDRPNYSRVAAVVAVARPGEHSQGLAGQPGRAWAKSLILLEIKNISLFV